MPTPFLDLLRVYTLHLFLILFNDRYNDRRDRAIIVLSNQTGPASKETTGLHRVCYILALG